jgi:hypothetical protein
MDPMREIMMNPKVESADSHLSEHHLEYFPRGRWNPECLLERALLAYPDAFGDRWTPALSQARECVLREGDGASREALERDVPAREAHAQIARMQRILKGRPTATERTAPALLLWSEGLAIALAHPVPHANSSVTVRIQTVLHPEVASAGAQRVEPSPRVLERWAALGYPRPPHSVWRCDPPSWMFGLQDFVVEVSPNPRGFNEAMLVAHLGAGRVLVAHPNGEVNNSERQALRATVMPSGWSYLRGDRTMGSSHPTLPSGAPHPPTTVRVPDPDLFALCASLTWTACLRDAIWLRHRTDYRILL